MYQFHTAFEDTVLSPAWKDELSDQAYAEMQQRFVEIERKMIGESGYNDALNKIAQVETELGIGDLSKHTMPVTQPR